LEFVDEKAGGRKKRAGEKEVEKKRRSFLTAPVAIVFCL